MIEGRRLHCAGNSASQARLRPGSVITYLFDAGAGTLCRRPCDGRGNNLDLGFDLYAPDGTRLVGVTMSSAEAVLDGVNWLRAGAMR